jgi:hypothetical protein
MSSSFEVALINVGTEIVGMDVSMPIGRGAKVELYEVLLRHDILLLPDVKCWAIMYTSVNVSGSRVPSDARDPLSRAHALHHVPRSRQHYISDYRQDSRTALAGSVHICCFTCDLRFLLLRLRQQTREKTCVVRHHFSIRRR